LLARNLAIGWQLHQAQARPLVIGEPRAFRAHHVDGLGLCARRPDTLVLHAPPDAATGVFLPWTAVSVQHAA
jgi:hypothetical protein